jgi:hypothetical protein
MAIVYRIYSNNDTGGLVDFSAPLASTTGLTYTFSPLGASTDTTFVVRAFDPEADLEEANTEALVRVVIGPDGAEVGGRPNPPHALSLTPSFGGGCRVSWAYAPAEQCGIPAGFHVYLTPVDSVHNSIPTAVVPYVAGRIGYSTLLLGPFTLSDYTASVASFDATGDGADSGSVTRTLGIPTATFVMESVNVSQS